MNKQAAKTRIDKLRDLINDYRYHYHVLDQSTMSEAAADSLKHELVQLEAQFPDLITPDSPTQRVAGAISAGFTSVPHSQRMLSLNDVFNETELRAWLARITKLMPAGAQPEFFADLKMDGLACALIYKDGVLNQAITRGDGTTGEDVTANVRTIDSVPLRLQGAKPGTIEVRGEIVMYKADFAQLNKQRELRGLSLFANPRNTAAGTIRQLDSSLVASRPLRFHAYDLARAPEPPATYGEAYQILRHLGFKANAQACVMKSIDEVIAFAEVWDDRRHDLPFHTDGLVVKINQRELYARLGIVGKAPRAAAAYKYAAEEATTTIKDIVISIGRTGAATPVAVFEPVVVSGSTVQHASLHNADEIARKDIRVGDTVIIYKAGDIIPQVQKVLTELRPKVARRFDMEAQLSRQHPELDFVRPDGEVVYRIKGVTSKLLLKQALVHFASKAALDIDTLGEKNVSALVDAGLVGDLADIYRLQKDQLLALERFAELSADNLLRGIAATTSPPLPRFVYGLGIRHVGVQTAIDLSNHFHTLDRLGTASLTELREVEGIGDIVADSILLWFDEEQNQQLLAKFRAHGVWPQAVKLKKGKLSGQKFVITGSLETMSRDQAAEKIRSLGGTFQTSTGKDTDYLVTGANVGAAKLTKAQAYGTEIIDEPKLLEMLI